SDADAADTLAVSAVNDDPLAVGSPITLASGATLTVNGDGTFTYDPTTSATLNALAAGDSTTDSFTYTIADPYGATSTATVTMTITGVNDSPSLTADATLAAVNEDTANPPGASVNDLFGASFSDPDTGASFAGIAVVGNTAAAGQGVWQYSADGTNWAD